MNYIREFLYRPKRSDRSLMARFFYADEALNAVAAELDSFDGRKDPERCAALVHKLRGCQDALLSICGSMLEQLEPGCREAIREFRAKFPDDILHENLAGQLWFGAECLAAGSSILNKESESEAMRPLAKAVTKSLERVRSLLREQCLRPNPEYTEKIRENLKIFDRLFSEFEFKYVQCMVHVKTIKEYELHQDIIILFSNTLMRSLELQLVTQEMVDYCDPSLMFAIPRLAIVTGLLFQPEGPLNVDKSNSSFPELFLPFKNLLRKIRELLQTLEVSEVIVLEMLLCQLEEPANLSVKLKEVHDRLQENEKKEQAQKLQAKLESPLEEASNASPIFESPCCTCDENPPAKVNDAVVKPILDAVISVVIDATNPGEDLRDMEECRKRSRRRRRKSSPSSSSSSSSSSSPLDCPLKRVNARREPKRIPYKFQKDKRARFKSTEDLLHRLYVCISGAADQLQSNYAGDFRSILKTVFLMNTAVDEEELHGAADSHSSSSSMVPLPSHSSTSGEDSSGEEEEEREETPTAAAAIRRRTPPPMVIPASESSYHIDWGTDALQQEMSDASLRRLQGEDELYEEPSRNTYVRNLNIIQDEENDTLIPRQFREEHEFYRDEPALMTIASGNNQQPTSHGVEEVRPEYVMEYLEPPAWVPDEAAPICMGCSDTFTIFKRRHHCRSCGLVFCYRCSGQSVPLPQYGIDKPVRVCNRCYYFYKKTSPRNQTSRSNNSNNSSLWTRHFGMVS